jgi:tRNA (guanine-N7-)-methyltransferase
MSIRLAVTYMLLVTANISRTSVALRSLRVVHHLWPTSNSARQICVSTGRFHIRSSEGNRHFLPPSMMVDQISNPQYTESLSKAREEQIDEDEEIPLSEEEKRAKELVGDEEDDILDDDDDDDDDDDEDSTDPKSRKFNEGSLRLKVRQHVNPLSSRYLIPMEGGEEWVAKAFADTTLPVIVDIGCAKGSWVLKYGAENPERNIVGLEIRKPVVEFALQRKKKWGLKNVHFLSVNANIDLDRILRDLKNTGGSIEMVTIQFPDPHFKKKHKKRRVVNELLVNTIVSHLEKGKKIFLQSDILDVTEDMIMNFSNNCQLERVEGFDSENLDQNISPNNVLTEREVATQKKGLPIYRMMFRKIK